MRVRIDRGTEAVRVELGHAAAARRAEVAKGVAVFYDAAGRISGVELRGLDPAGLHSFTVELAGLADMPAAEPASPPAADAAAPPPVATTPTVPVPTPSAIAPVPSPPPVSARPDGLPAPAAPPPPPVPHTGPLSWDPEAEAAVVRLPFFQRGQTRLAASALARKRGLDRVTVDVVEGVGR